VAKKKKLYKIEIQNLCFDAIIGILDFEREKEQKIIVTCKIKYPYSKDEFINYAHVCELIQNDIKTSKYLLIENALENLEKLLLAHFPHIKALKLKISKPDILENCDVGVVISRNY
jgi:dihydroneopterin aldolase